jgi:hypothetical protein
MLGSCRNIGRSEKIQGCTYPRETGLILYVIEVSNTSLTRCFKLGNCKTVLKYPLCTFGRSSVSSAALDLPSVDTLNASRTDGYTRRI